KSLQAKPKACAKKRENETNTTLNKIRRHTPCTPTREKSLASLGKTKADDEPVSFRYLLDTLGLKDAVWCLRTLDYKERCLFLADVAESVLPKFEKYSDGPAPRKCVQAIRDYEQGLIDDASLKAASKAASVSYTTARTTYGDTAAFAAATAIAYAADTITDPPIVTSYAALTAEGDRAIDKWKEIETLFIKHFVEESQ
ncbi:MAG: hypothetical protein GY814_00755, partial [Gammaproteobacteria bacterium]|nr:hypothetical protein [Gammaproteobacteria bacterium]